jgi:hypothetical protein
MTFRIPTPDWRDLRPNENLLGWLTRTDPDQGWVYDDLTQEPKAPSDPDLESPYVWTIRPSFSSAEFLAYVAAKLQLTNPAWLSPIWPGLENARVGGPYELADGLVVPGPMRGLVFAISRISPGGGRWKFGDVSSWNNVGAVAFLDDNGDYERPITISVDTQVVVPIAMVRATSAIIRFTAPFAGTVSAWVYVTDD